MKVSCEWINSFFPKTSQVRPEVLRDAFFYMGFPVTDLQQLAGDTVLTLEIPENRPDCHCILGLAREAGMALGIGIQLPATEYRDLEDSSVFEQLDTDVTNNACFRYSARMVTDLRFFRTPQWMEERLSLYGMNSQNIFSDLCSYVLLEMGQPIGCFDRSLFPNGSLCICDSLPGSSFSFAGKNYTFEESFPVYTEDFMEIKAFPGIKNKEFCENAESLILDAGCYDPQVMGANCRQFGNDFPALTQHCLGLDPMGTLPALDRICSLIDSLGCGKILSGTLDTLNYVPQPVTVPLSQLRPLTHFSREEEAKILSRAGVSLEDGILTIPSRRSDLRTAEDLHQEARRILAGAQADCS